MDLRGVFYRHPYASMVTLVFLFSLLLTSVYVLGLGPVGRATQSQSDRFLLITGVLLVTTAAAWTVGISLRSYDR